MRNAKGRRLRKGTVVDDAPADEGATPGEEAAQKDLWFQFQERFPNLAAEIEESRPALRIDGVRWQQTDGAETTGTPEQARFARYEPDIIDFLRRCGTEQEAQEIIAFMEERHEIDAKHAEALRRQLRARGLRSFGPKKSWGHYEREG